MWNDFNDCQGQTNFDLIPNNTIAKVRMTIKPGGYDDKSQGWDGGYATRNFDTGSIYLMCDFVVLEGKYTKRRVLGIIGLHSPKGTEWQNIGRSFIKSILNSAYGFLDSDNSQAAQNARKINGLADLDGIEFVAKITIKKDQNDEPRNEIRFAISPDHKDYKAAMGIMAPVKTQHFAAASPASDNRPAWAR